VTMPRVATLAFGLLAALALAGGPAPAGAAAPEEAKAIVARTLDEVLGVLRNRELAADARRLEVERIAYARFDFATISRLVLARNWPNLSAAQQQDFITEFKRHLTLTYWKTLEDYRDEDVEVDGVRAEKNSDVTVRTTIPGERTAPIRIDYRMRPADGSFVVIDVIIESVSLVQNFRAQTQEIVAKDGVDALIEKLRQRNDARVREASG
jgi:phospholipid transport system substrate-binding protein